MLLVSSWKEMQFPKHPVVVGVYRENILRTQRQMEPRRWAGCVGNEYPPCTGDDWTRQPGSASRSAILTPASSVKSTTPNMISSAAQYTNAGWKSVQEGRGQSPLVLWMTPWLLGSSDRLWSNRAESNWASLPVSRPEGVSARTDNCREPQQRERMCGLERKRQRRWS